MNHPLPTNLDDLRLAVIGLDDAGLPLAKAFSTHRPVLGFDINPARITALQASRDATLEAGDEELRRATGLCYTADPADLAGYTVFIVTVPAAIDRNKRLDPDPILAASATIGQVLKPGGIVIYESTVYPGTTETDCVPVLERYSGLMYNSDFHVGYSPERIIPGDKAHHGGTIQKVTSGSTAEAAELIDRLYQQIITAGTHRAGSIRVAEAAQMLENAQCDLNVDLTSELAVFFNRMGIHT